MWGKASAGVGLALLVLEAGQEIVEAEDHADAGAVVGGQRQADPVLHQVLLVHPGPTHDALGWLAINRSVAIGSHPVVALETEVEVVDVQPGDLPVEDVAQPCAGQPDPGTLDRVTHVDQADEGQKPRNVGGIDVGAGGQQTLFCAGQTVVLELALLGHNQLCPECYVDRTFSQLRPLRLDALLNDSFMNRERLIRKSQAE